MLAETERAQGGTFSSAFTRNRGLEPTDPLPVHQARHYVGAIAT